MESRAPPCGDPPYLGTSSCLPQAAPKRAIRCGLALVGALAAIGIAIRVGVHSRANGGGAPKQIPAGTSIGPGGYCVMDIAPGFLNNTPALVRVQCRPHQALGRLEDKPSVVPNWRHWRADPSCPRRRLRRMTEMPSECGLDLILDGLKRQLASR